MGNDLGPKSKVGISNPPFSKRFEQPVTSYGQKTELCPERFFTHNSSLVAQLALEMADYLFQLLIPVSKYGSFMQYCTICVGWVGQGRASLYTYFVVDVVDVVDAAWM